MKLHREIRSSLASSACVPSQLSRRVSSSAAPSPQRKVSQTPRFPADIVAALPAAGVSPADIAQLELPVSVTSPVPSSGTLPPIWNVPHTRNLLFTGRDGLLTMLHAALTSGQHAALTQVLNGLGGVGKTQLAVEYAYRYAKEYMIVWWIHAEEPATLASNYAGLAEPLELPGRAASEQAAVVAAVQRWLERHNGWLLIFDNVAEPTGVRGYLPRGATGHVLITSRNPNWRGIAGPLAVPVLDRAAAVSFLLTATRTR